MTDEVKNKNTDDGSSADEAQGKMDSLAKERDEYLNGWKRAKADLINYQKEEGKRFEEVALFSNQALVRELLGVLDSFSLALTSSATPESEKKGLTLIKSQLEEVLKRQRVERINVKTGDSFDSNVHEAIGEVEWKENDGMSGKVVEELVSGYRMNGKIIRPAKVKIAK